jgi:hydrogenase/urease accessory protein HupE
MNFIFTRSLILLFVLTGMYASAHEIRPAYLEIREKSLHEFTVFWKQPTMGEFSLRLSPKLGNWLVDSAATTVFDDNFMIRKWDIQTGKDSLNGQKIYIEGLNSTMTDVLVSIHFLSGETITQLLRPVEPEFVVQRSHHQSAPVAAYLQLGIYHILFGIDHLLFVLGLILLVKGTRRLIKTITAFTIAHSITLALATLHLVNVLQAAAEATIALSIVFLALELVRHYQGRDGLTFHYPWVVAFVFGLLHGFGFAGALREVGLPASSIPMALFLFNVGVEIGQLIFVFSVLGLMWGYRKWGPALPARTRFLAPYIIGSLAAFWLIQRMVLIL